MIRLFLFSTITLFLNQNSYAQMAQSSIFSEMKALNPAVISERPSATFSAYIKNDKSTKEQDLSGKYGDGSEANEDAVLSSTNFFYGGKGGGVTVEVLSDIATGELEFDFNLTNQTQGESSYSGEANTTFLSLGIGLGDHFGLSFATQNMSSESSFTATVNTGSGAETINTISETEQTTNRIRAGFRATFGVDLGAYYEYQKSETDSEDNSGSSGAGGDFDPDEATSTIGLGVGHKTSNFRIEAFFEKRLEDEETPNGDTYSPARYGGTIEARFGNIAVGYTGKYYVDGFSDLENTLYDQLIYSGSLYEPRLENTINFSFGGEKGHSIGGSYSQTTIENKETAKIDSDTEFDTITVVQGISVSYRYSF